MNYSSRNTLLAALAVIFLICMYNWIVKPHTAYLQAAQRYDSVTQGLISKSRSLPGKIKTSKRKLEKLQDKFERSTKRLFSKEECDELFSNIENICNETNCVMKSLNFEPEKSAAESAEEINITAISATLNADGMYQNIVMLINKLQQRPQRVWINSLSVEKINDDSAQLECEMTITIYVMHDRERSSSG